MRNNKIQPNELSPETKKSMKVRIITAIVGICVVLPCIFIGDWVFFSLIFVVAGIATYEVIRASQKNYKIFVYVFTYVCVYCLIYWVFLKHGLANPDMFWDLPSAFCENPLFVSMMAACISLGVYFFLSVLDKNFSIDDVFYLFSMTLLISIGLQSILFLRYFSIYSFRGLGVDTNDPVFKYCTSATLFIYLGLGTYMTDTGAYFAGVLFGRHKMNERISPKKTWEGFVGGIIISMIVSVSFCLILDACGCPVLPIFTCANWYWVLLVSAVMPLVASLGDFSLSAVKRHFKIKDFGNILPGHGGVLDRIDSILFSSITVSIFVFFISNGWRFI